VASDLCGFVLGSWCAFFLSVFVFGCSLQCFVFVVLFPFCGGSLHCFVHLWRLLVALLAACWLLGTPLLVNQIPNQQSFAGYLIGIRIL